VDTTTYLRRRVGPGEADMTKEDDVVFANIILFRIYGAMKLWYEYANIFEPPHAASRPLFGLAGFSTDQIARLGRFFRMLTGRHDLKKGLACLTTKQHQVPQYIYAMEKGALSFVIEVIGTFPSMIKTTATNTDISNPVPKPGFGTSWPSVCMLT
jgi:hypothetical protein